MIRVSRYRRYTSNRTFHLDFLSRRLFVKVNPHRAEAEREIFGLSQINGYYPIAPIQSVFRYGKWIIIVSHRMEVEGKDSGLLLDEIAHCRSGGSLARLDACLDSIIEIYKQNFQSTACRIPQGGTVQKLYGDRARQGGRIDQYYGKNRALIELQNGFGVYPNTLKDVPLIINGRTYRIDFGKVIDETRNQLAADCMTWAALSQGDPTDFNLGWTPKTGPVWFDYDTAGLNSIAGEIACFLWYQYFQADFIVPLYNPAAFEDHPLALQVSQDHRPDVEVCQRDAALRIRYKHRPSPTRQHVMKRYWCELVLPTAHALQIGDLTSWLRPWLIMRLIAVHDLTVLAPQHSATCLANLAWITADDFDVEQLLLGHRLLAAGGSK